VPVDLRARLRHVTLGALATDQVEAMAADLLGADAIGLDLARLLHRTAEGNPLYLEEIIKALHQAGRVYHEGAVARLRDPGVDPGLPPTLQGLIAARIDLLDVASRGALQVAAVLGPSFSAALLGAAVGADDPTLLIGELVRAGLIVPEDRTPDTGYAFASILVWECVVRSILGIQRREYHRMVASGMERLYGDRLDTVAEAWAGHCHAGGRLRDAASGMARAGHVHRRGQFLERALECYERGITWLRQAPRDQDDPELEGLLHLCAGEVALLLGRPRAEKLLQFALDIATDTGISRYEARALLALGQHYQSQGKSSLARAHLDAAASLARGLKDPAALVACLEALGAQALDEGRVDEGRSTYEEGLRVAGEDRALAARMLLGLSNHALRRDDMPSALALLFAAEPYAEEANDRILLGRITNNLGIVLFNQGKWDDALAQFRRALELRQGLGYRVGEITNLHNIGDALMRRGDFAHAYASFEQSRDLARECAWERGVVMNEVFLCYLRGLRGEAVLEDLEHVTRAAQRVGDKETAILARSFAARLQGAAGERQLRAAEAEARAAGFAGLARQIAEAG
jgi:tetratricopeptide (TPR) repeat protein